MLINISQPEESNLRSTSFNSSNNMASNRRISVSSLLNSINEPTRSITPASVGGPPYSTSAGSSRENSMTPSSNNTSPSPTMSQVSWSSLGSSRRSVPASRFRGGSRGSSRTATSSVRNAYAPYSTDRRRKTGTTTRQSRPNYDLEEAHFIWYLKIDLGLGWEAVRKRFNQQFARQRTGIQGLQCKFYRFLTDNGLPAVRERNRNPDARRAYSLRTLRPDLWYNWMGTEASAAANPSTS